MLFTKRMKLLAGGACVAFAVSACGGAGNQANGSTLGADAASSVRQAARSTLDQPGFSLKVSLGVTGEQLQQLQQQQPSGGGGDLSQQALDAIAGGSITVNLHTTNGQTLSKALSHENGSPDTNLGFDLAINVNGGAPIDFRVLGSRLFAKLDLPSLAQVFAISSSTVQGFQSVLQSLDSKVPGLASLGQGKWVTADLAPIIKMAEQQQPPQQHPQPHALQTMINDVSQAFTKNSTSKRVGTSNGRTEYNVTFDAGAVVNSALSNWANIQGLGQLSGLVPKLPNGKTVMVQVFQKGGKVVEIDLDLNQFANPKAPFPIPLRLQFGSGSPVVAPSGATNLDLSNLMQVLGSQASGASSGS